MCGGRVGGVGTLRLELGRRGQGPLSYRGTTVESMPPSSDHEAMRRLREQLVPGAMGLALAAPVLLYRYPPMADLPMHEALVAMMHHLHDPRWAPEGMYYVVAPRANQLFHFLAYALSFATRTDTACKLIVAAIVAASPVALARHLSALRLEPWGAMLILPVAYGWMFGWGLVANLLGFTLLLFFLPLADRLARRGSARDIAAATLASCVLMFAHEATAIAFALIVAYAVLVRSPRSLATLLTRSAPIVATLLLALAQWRTSSSLLSATMVGIGDAQGPTTYERLVALPGAIFGSHGATRLALLGGCWFGAIGAGSLARRHGRLRRVPMRALLWRLRYAVLAVLFLLLFFTFPLALGGTTLLYHRFLPPACACAILAATPRVTRRSAREATHPRGAVAARAFRVLVVFVPLATAWVHHPRFAQAHETFLALDAVLAHIPDGSSVAQLELTPLQAGGAVAPVPGAASRAQAEHGGRMLFAFTDTPPNPVYTRSDARWIEPTVRLAQQPFAFTPEHDGRRFTFLLARATDTAYRPLVRAALAPTLELVAARGEWELYRSTAAPIPLDSPDVPLPEPPPETLAEAIRRTAAARRLR